MNIGQLLRAVIGDVTPGDPKLLELKIGQVVKGLVLKLLSEQDAMVNIGGAVVRARLETPLRQGQVTFLQVQPESTNGQILLKPLADSEVPLPGEGAAMLLKNLGLPDRASNRQAVQMLHLEGTQVTKETVDGLARVLQEKPAAVAEDEWKTASLLAVKKNLPVTRESVASLRSVLFESPIHQAASDLEEKLSQMLSDGAPLSAPSTELVRKLVNGIGQLREQTAELLSPETEVKSEPAQNETVSSAAPAEGKAPVSQPSVSRQPPNLAQEATRISPAQTSPSASAATLPPGDGDQPESKNAMSPDLSVRPGAISPPSLNKAVPDETNSSGLNLINGTTVSKGREEARTVSSMPISSSAAGMTEQESTRPPTSGLLPGLLKLLGFDHEQKWSRLLQEDASMLPVDAGAQEGDSPSSDSVAGQSDSLKSLLLQLTSSDHDVPQPIKDTAQQLLQSLTGTQLLLSPDRSVPFTQVTLTLPLLHGNGEQTAAVHIQSRTGKRGELDAENCRLLFDLQMRTMGLTLVDVRVVDRMVSLEVRNDQEQARAWIDGYREEIASGLKAAGYQLASLKSLPFPNQPLDAEEIGKASTSEDGARIVSRYQAKPYKGMDIRV